MAKAQNGRSMYYNLDYLACGGARRYLGYVEKMRPDFEYFLPCGNDQMEGERYVGTAEMVKDFMKNLKNQPCRCCLLAD